MSKKCIFCGSLLEDNDLYCSECGQKQEESVAVPKKKKDTIFSLKQPPFLMIGIIRIFL